MEHKSPDAAPATAAKKTATHKSTLPDVVEPGTFNAEAHFYPRVLNANLHPMVSTFMHLGHERIARRYCHMHPSTNEKGLLRWLKYECQYFRWSGSDLFTVTDSDGHRQVIVIETNSCPSGQKSMPVESEQNESGGYHVLLSKTFVPKLKALEAAGELPKGDLAVIYDKNEMETSGYAAELATLTGEKVHLVRYFDDEESAHVKWIDRVMHVRTKQGVEDTWVPIRAAFRYCTQKPWNRISMDSATMILNPIVACLAGGRNKSVAAKAYEIFNAELLEDGLGIRAPETIKDVSKNEIPLWVKSMGGHAVIKVPYSNAGQGVFTITSPAELKAFMETDIKYDKYIVQSLVGNSSWSSTHQQRRFYHVGTIPNKKNEIFVSDLRMMVCSGADGFTPLAVYARKAHKPLAEKLDDSNKSDSWSMLGTNLSVKKADGDWSTESQRLMLMDYKDFNKLGIGIDDLIDGFVQAVLATVAIDKLCIRLMKGGVFNKDLFFSLNADKVLMEELAQAEKAAV